MEKKLLRGVLSVVIILVFTAAISAQFATPHQFFGIVKDASGTSAPDGVLIIAKINGDDVAATTTKEGKYGRDSADIFYVEDPNENREGKPIEFFINDIKAAESTFRNGFSTNLDLLYSGTFNPPPTTSSGGGGSSGSGGGSSGGGGGGGSSSSGTTTQTGFGSCTPDWECSEWLDCINSIEKRVCADNNFCGNEDGKPIEKRDCTITKLPEGIIFLNFLTGAATGFVGTGTGIASLLFIVLIIVGVGVVIFLRRGSSAK